MEFEVFEFLIATMGVFLSVYFIGTWRLNYWKNRGIPGPSPVPIFGNFSEIFFRQSSMTEHAHKIYEDWKKYPLVGIYKGQVPMIVLHDLDLIKRILIKDFTVFPTRGIMYNEKIDPISAHLFSIDETEWRILRAKLSPIFTSGKLRQMLYLMVESADLFEKLLAERVGEKNIIECTSIAMKFTTDVIGVCAFGINMNAIAREDSDFHRIGKKIFEPNFQAVFVRFLRDASPALFKLFNMRTFPKETCDYFVTTIKENMRIREQEKIIRHDLIDLLLEIKRNNELTDEALTAQAFVFFAAGLGTSSLTIAYALYELAYSQDIQDKARSEILEIMGKHGGKLSYDIVRDMTYLNMVFQETTRKYPVIGVLEREAIETYEIPEMNLILEKGTKVLIPNHAIQQDPQYFPDPEVFDPERFSDEMEQSRHPMTYLPFGDGPRNCIGARFAVFQVKMAILKVLVNYRLKPTRLTPLPFEIDKSVFILSPKNGIHLEFQALSQP